MKNQHAGILFGLMGCLSFLGSMACTLDGDSWGALWLFICGAVMLLVSLDTMPRGGAV